MLNIIDMRAGLMLSPAEEMMPEPFLDLLAKLHWNEVERYN